jgi:hypothetical protein
VKPFFFFVYLCIIIIIEKKINEKGMNSLNTAQMELPTMPTATQKLIEARQELMVLHNQFQNLVNDPEVIDGIILKIRAKEAEIGLIRKDTNTEYYEIHNPIILDKPDSKVVKFFTNILNLIP